MKHFRLKDIFTSFNLFCVLCSLVLLYEGKFLLASYLLVFTIFVLDLLDGMVARKLGGGNLFGKEYDTIVDYCSCCIAPPFFIYVAYREYSLALALFTAFLPLFFGTIRGVQRKIENMEVENFFIGLPRPITGLLPIAVVNSALLKEHSLYLVGTLLILVFSVGNLSHALYLGNDKATLRVSVKIKIYLTLAVIFQITLTLVGCFWEGLVIFLTCYLIHPYVLETQKSRKTLMRSSVSSPS